MHKYRCGHIDFLRPEYCIQIDSAYVENGNTITLRAYRGTTALFSYLFTPSITVVEGGGGGVVIPVMMHHYKLLRE